MMRILREWPWALAALAIALVVHAVTVMLLPHLVMWRLLHTMAAASGYNSLHHSERASASSHGVVRPSPDLLYSACPYDLSQGPVLVRAAVPQGTYWSVSTFDADTNNFYVRNDHQTPGHIAFILFQRGSEPVGDTRRAVHVLSPTTRGLVLFRTLINDETNLAEIDSARRRASCEPFKPGGD